MLPVIALSVSIISVIIGAVACFLLVNVTQQVSSLTKTLGDVQKTLNGLTKTAENHQARIAKLEEKPKALSASSMPMNLVSQLAPGIVGTKWEPVLKIVISLAGMYFGNKIKRK